MRITRLALAALIVASSAHAADEQAPLAPMAPGAAPAASAPAARPSSAPSRWDPRRATRRATKAASHTVVRGDTLWDISEAYLGSPVVWPKIWKSNPGVKDPHWIYPGEQIWISATEMRPLTKQEASAVVPVSAAEHEDVEVRQVGAFPVPDMEKMGFVSAELFETAGSLLGSPEGEKWLAAHRRAYVSFGEGQVQVGDRFTVVRENEKVRDPETGRRLGVHVEKLGWLEITKVGPESSEAMVRVSTAEMQRGDRLIPRIEPALEVPVHVGTPAPVEGQIASCPNQRTIVSQRDVIFLNRGLDDGLDIGSALEVYRPGTVVKDHETRIKHHLPDEIVANLIVISAEPNSSLAIATHGILELARGDRFRTAPSATTSFRESTIPMESTQWTARTIEGRDEGLPSAAPAKAAPPAKP
jgi:hypothetical protein